MRLTVWGKGEGTFNLIFIGYIILNSVHLSQWLSLMVFWYHIYILLLIFLIVFFLHIGVEDVDISIGNDIETIKGTWKLHSIKTNLSANVFALDKRKYSCSFHVCINKTKSNNVCENKMYVKDWKHTKLNKKGKMFIAMFEEMQSEETTISSEGGQFSDLVREGSISFSFKWQISRNR